MTGNPHGYEAGFTIEQHRDDLIRRLGEAIKQIGEKDAAIQGLVREQGVLNSEYNARILELETNLAKEQSSHRLTLHAYEQTIKMVAERDRDLAAHARRIMRLTVAVEEAKRMLLPSMFGTPREEVDRLAQVYTEALRPPMAAEERRLAKLEAALEYIERTLPDGVQLVAVALSNAENKS